MARNTDPSEDGHDPECLAALSVKEIQKDVADLIAHPEIWRDALVFLDKLERLKVLTTVGDIPLKWEDADNVVIDLRSLTAAGSSAGSTVPPPTSSGQVLVSNGTAFNWFP